MTQQQETTRKRRQQEGAEKRGVGQKVKQVGPVEKDKPKPSAESAVKEKMAGTDLAEIARRNKAAKAAKGKTTTIPAPPKAPAKPAPPKKPSTTTTTAPGGIQSPGAGMVGRRKTRGF